MFVTSCGIASTAPLQQRKTTTDLLTLPGVTMRSATTCSSTGGIVAPVPCADTCGVKLAIGVKEISQGQLTSGGALQQGTGHS